MSTEGLSESARRLLDAVPEALEDGVELLEWWKKADADHSYARRYKESFVANRPDDQSYGFFDSVELTSGKIPVNGNVQKMFYDEPKAPPDYEGAADEWMNDQIREFILKYFMRISDYRRPQLYPESHPEPPPGLGFLSQCPDSDDEATGFGFSQIYYKRKKDGEIVEFPEAERDKIVDLRRLRNELEWVVLKNPIFGFGFEVKLFGNLLEDLVGASGPRVTVPAQVYNYLVISNDFVVNEENPEPGVRGRYGFGYAFVNDPEPSLYGYGPGQLQPGYEQLVWEVRDTGEVQVTASFVAREPREILRLSVDPLAWGYQLTKALGGEFPEGWKRFYDSLPLTNMTFDPVLPSVRLLNLFTLGQAARRFCISKDHLVKEALFLHFLQHYQTILGSLQTWRQVPDWTAKEAKLPEFVTSGKSS